jgi:hypothetical protein
MNVVWTACVLKLGNTGKLEEFFETTDYQNSHKEKEII